MLATTVDFLKESGQVLLVMTGPLTDAIRGVNQLTRTSCSRCPCESTTFQENLTVSAASTSGGSSPFLLGYEKHPNCLGRTFENTCAKVKNKFCIFIKTVINVVFMKNNPIFYISKLINFIKFEIL